MSERDYSEGFGEDGFGVAEFSPEWTPPTQLFQGVTRTNGWPRQLVGLNTAVEGDVVNRNALTHMTGQVCTDKQSLASALDLKLDGGAAIEDTAAASAKLGVINNVNVSYHDVTITIYCKHVPWVRYGQQARYREGVNPTDPRFSNYYGNYWVSQIAHGAEFIFLYNYKARTYEQRMAILTSLKANGALLGGSLSFDAGLNSKLETVSKQHMAQESHRIVGLSSPPLFRPLKTDSHDYCESFISKTPDAPVVSDIDLTDYRSVIPRS